VTEVTKFPRNVEYRGYLIEIRPDGDHFEFKVSRKVNLNLFGTEASRSGAIRAARIMIDKLGD